MNLEKLTFRALTLRQSKNKKEPVILINGVVKTLCFSREFGAEVEGLYETREFLENFDQCAKRDNKPAYQYL